MRFQLKSIALFSALAVLTMVACATLQAQSTASATAGNGTYVASDPLAGVSYDNKYDISVGMGYRHIMAGPNLFEAGDLGGLDINGSYWLSRHWGLEATARGYAGTSGAAPNTIGVRGPFIQNYIFAAGAEYLGPHSKHAALIAHVMGGGTYGKFEGDLHGNSPLLVDFYNDQIAPAGVVGGHIDLNRSARWVFRITPDAVFTRFNQSGTTTQGAKIDVTKTDVNFAISVGVEYKFRKKR